LTSQTKNGAAEWGLWLFWSIALKWVFMFSSFNFLLFGP
jgi:hypothetical protein